MSPRRLQQHSIRLFIESVPVPSRDPKTSVQGPEPRAPLGIHSVFTRPHTSVHDNGYVLVTTATLQALIALKSYPFMRSRFSNSISRKARVIAHVPVTGVTRDFAVFRLEEERAFVEAPGQQIKAHRVS